MIRCGSGESCNGAAAPGHYVCADHLEALLPSIERLGYVTRGEPTRCLAGDCRHAAWKGGYCRDHGAERRKAERLLAAEAEREQEVASMASCVLEKLTDDPISQPALATKLGVGPSAVAFRRAITRLVEIGRADQTSTGLRLAPPPVMGRAEKLARLVAESDTPLTYAELERELDTTQRTLGRAVSEAKKHGWVDKLPGRTARLVTGPTPLAA
jgi:biotin operon repressor